MTLSQFIEKYGTTTPSLLITNAAIDLSNGGLIKKQAETIKFLLELSKDLKEALESVDRTKL